MACICTVTSGKSKVGVGVIVGVGDMVGVKVIVGVKVLVTVGVGVAVGTGEGEGEFVGVKLAVKEAVGVEVGEAIISGPQAERKINKGTNSNNKAHLPVHKISCFLLIV